MWTVLGEIRGDTRRVGTRTPSESKGKVKVYKTPDSVLQAQLKIWDEVIAKKSTADNPWFEKVLDSQKAFAQRAGNWKYDQEVNFRMAFNHYFRA